MIVGMSCALGVLVEWSSLLQKGARSINRDKGTCSTQDLLEDSVGEMATSGLAFFEERRATEFATEIRQVG